MDILARCLPSKKGLFLYEEKFQPFTLQPGFIQPGDIDLLASF